MSEVGQEPQSQQEEKTSEQQSSVQQEQTPEPAKTADEWRSVAEREIRERKEANAEAHKLRARLRELEAAEDERKKASMTEQERVQKELEDTRKALEQTRQQYREMQIRLSVDNAARAIGVIDTDAAFRLMDQSKLVFDDAGNPQNVNELIAELVKEKPYLASPATKPANPTKGAGSQAGREEELRALLYGNPAGPFEVRPDGVVWGEKPA